MNISEISGSVKAASIIKSFIGGIYHAEILKSDVFKEMKSKSKSNIFSTFDDLTGAIDIFIAGAKAEEGKYCHLFE